MKATICPTIDAQTVEEYRRQMDKVVPFVTRVHIDTADGKLAPVELVQPDNIWWPGGVRADIHVMFQRPFECTDILFGLKPQLIIVHAEAEGDFVGFAEAAHRHGIEVGVALLPPTQTGVIKPALHFIDHVLIFSGNFGHFGGTADTHLLTKVLQLRRLKPQLEIGWDGGVNQQNIKTLAAAGVEVLNVGGFIQKAPDAQAAFTTLQAALTDPVEAS